MTFTIITRLRVTPHLFPSNDGNIARITLNAVSNRTHTHTTTYIQAFVQLNVVEQSNRAIDAVHSI